MLIKRKSKLNQLHNLQSNQLSAKQYTKNSQLKSQKSSEEILRELKDADLSAVDFWYDDDRYNYDLELKRVSDIDKKIGTAISLLSLLTTTSAIIYTQFSDLTFLTFFILILGINLCGYIFSILGLWPRKFAYLETVDDLGGFKSKGSDLKKIYAIKYREHKILNSITIDKKAKLFKMVMITILFSLVSLLIGLFVEILMNSNL